MLDPPNSDVACATPPLTFPLSPPLTHHFGRKLEELRLGSGRVSQQQHIDVSPAVGAVWQRLARAPKQQRGDSLLDLVSAEDVGRDLGEDLRKRVDGSVEVWGGMWVSLCGALGACLGVLATPRD